MDIEKVVHEVTETLQRDANARAVFGDPIQLEGRTIVPVAMVTIELGGGGGAGGRASDGEKPRGFGGGGGVDVKTVPVGFIHEQDGAVRFTSITLPAVRRSPRAGLLEKLLASLWS